MSIEESVKKVLKDDGKEREKSENFRNLRDFYQQMKDEGLVIQQDYTLPPIDTIGRSFYATQKVTPKDQ